MLLLHEQNEHTELCTPIANVVDTQHVLAAELKQTADALTDDGGTQVTHVHLLGDVRGAKVDQHTLLLDPRRREDTSGDDTGACLRSPVLTDVDVDEAFLGAFCSLNQVIRGHGANELGANVLGTHLDRRGQSGELLGEAHGVIALEVGLAPGSDEDLRDGVHSGERCGDGRLEEILQCDLHVVDQNLLHSEC